MVLLEQWGVEVVSCYDGVVTLGREWAIGDVDIDDLISRREFIEGLPFAPLDDVRRYKQISRRPKDLEHLARIEEFAGD